MEAVENELITSCKEQKQLMKFVRKKLNDPNIYLDVKTVENSVNKPERYFPYKLYDWQKFCNAFIFGLRYKANNKLVFSRYLLMMGRGGGKNGYISYNSFFALTTYLGVNRYDIELVANSEDQAKTSFKDVYEVIDDNEMKKIFYYTKELIQHRKTKSNFQFNTSNAKTKDSKRSGMIIFDEIHAYEDYTQIKVFTSGLGKVEDPRTFFATTNGEVRGGVLDDLLEESEKVLSGEIETSDLFPFICRLDNANEVDNPQMWSKANPSLRFNDTLLQLMNTEYSNMQHNYALRQEFMTKRMNYPIASGRKVVVEYEKLLKTNQEMVDLTGLTCVGALDYAELKDFCAVGLLFRKGGKRYWIQHTFMHHLAPKLQNINLEIINLAIEQGLITVVYDEIIKPEMIVEWFVMMGENYHIKMVKMDLFRASVLKNAFSEAGIEIETVRKGVITHSLVAPLVEQLFTSEDIIFANDPLMRWYVGNVYKEELPNGNIEYKKIDKVKRKTDGFFAFLHALLSDEELEDYEVSQRSADDVGTFSF